MAELYLPFQLLNLNQIEMVMQHQVMVMRHHVVVMECYCLPISS